VLNKSGTYGQTLMKVPNIKFHNNLSCGRQVVPCRQADQTNEASYLLKGGTHLKKYSEFWAMTENGC
jgi:hypothetical protein